MSVLADILRERPDLAALVEQGMETVILHVVALEQELKEARASRRPIGDSRTTHAAPSTDPRPKPRSQRRKTGRKTGGQPGHPGHRLEPVSNPDQVVVHGVDVCAHCDCDLGNTPVVGIAKHQVFDLPKMPLTVTEHQLQTKFCPDCDEITTAPAPAGAEQPTQYGPRLAGFALLLHVGHFVPLERTADIIEDLTGHRVSEGWICACKTRLSARLDPFIAAVTAGLRALKAVFCDETGFRFANKRYWLHVCCSATLTLLLCHRKRGIEGTNALKVLPGYTGTAIHDHWPSYFSYTSCSHGVCNEHHVRELDGVSERTGQAWAAALKQVLYDGLDLKRLYHGLGQDIPSCDISTITARYEQCLRDGHLANPRPPPRLAPKRGPPKRGKTLALLDRLRDRQTETLLFLHDEQVAWSNNQAEQDIRIMKTQQKITGGFRTETGAIEFCRIRSYLSTVSKNHIDPVDAIASALAGNPWLPQGTSAQTSTESQAA